MRPLDSNEADEQRPIKMNTKAWVDRPQHGGMDGNLLDTIEVEEVIIGGETDDLRGRLEGDSESVRERLEWVPNAHLAM